MAKRLINEDGLLIFLRSIKDYVDNNFSGDGNLRDIINNIRKKLLEINKEIENLTLTDLNGIEEAPEDDQYYLRRNKDWETIPVIDNKPTGPDPGDTDDPEDPNKPTDPDKPENPYPSYDGYYASGTSLDFGYEGGSASATIRVYGLPYWDEYGWYYYYELVDQRGGGDFCSWDGSTVTCKYNNSGGTSTFYDNIYNVYAKNDRYNWGNPVFLNQITGFIHIFQEANPNYKNEE